MNIKNRRAFTLAEMMVVLLVLSLVMTAFLPVITKRSKVASSSGGIWQYMSNNSDIFSQTGPTQATALGISSLASNDNTKLLINTSSPDQSSILFKQNNVESGKLIMTGATAGSVYGASDVGLGKVTLEGTTIKGANTAIGAGANASSNSNGDNTALGCNAKALGGYSTAIGDTAQATGSTDGRTVAVGYTAKALADYSTAVGPYSKADGGNDVALGQGAMTNAGYGAIAIGADAQPSGGGYGITIGLGTRSTASGVAIGHSAQATQDATIAIGNGAQATTYAGNVAIGNGARATNGGSLTVIGNGATAADSAGGGTAIGESANAGGWVATAIGYGVKAKGVGSVAIGVDSSGNSAQTSTNDEILLGTIKHTVRIPGALYVGNGNAGGNFIPGGGGSNWTTSDRRLKDVKGDFVDGLDKIRMIQPINFTYKKDKEKVPHVGVIAQDLQKIFPEAIINGPDGYLMIRQDDMFYAMINSIKQLDEIVQGLVRDLKSLVGRVQQLESKVLSVMRIEQSNSQKIQSLETRNKALESRITKLEKSIKK